MRSVVMNRLRFMCFASLLALILALGLVSADSPTPSTTMDGITAEAGCKNTTDEDDPLSDSATITITWTTVGPPEE